MRSRNVSPGFDVMRDLDPVRQHLGAAGDGAAVAAGFADDRRALAGDDRFVDDGDALDDVAVAGDDVARLADDDVAGAQLRGRDLLDAAAGSDALARCVSVLVLRSVSACALPRASAIASAKLANSTVNHSQSAIWMPKPTSAARR